MERYRNNRYAKPHSSSYGDLHYLQSVRIIQRSLVYIIGLSPSLAEESVLRSNYLFGQYGAIKKIILNNSSQLIEKVHSCCACVALLPLHSQIHHLLLSPRGSVLHHGV